MMWLQIWKLLRRQEGQDLTEYALLIGLIVVVAVAAIVLLGETISSVLNFVASTLSSALG